MNTRASPVDTPTPRTDAAFDALNHDRQFAVMACGFSDFARSLERSLAASEAREGRLRAIVIQYASECGECGGTGTVDRKTWPGGIEVDYEAPCEDCAFIRAALKETP